MRVTVGACRAPITRIQTLACAHGRVGAEASGAHSGRCARSPPAPGERTDIAPKLRTLIDPGREAPALRRAAVLLERVRQDGGGSDIAELEAGVAAMRRAAAAGRLVHYSALDRMTAMLARIAPLPCVGGAGVGEIVRCNALTETRELLARLSGSTRARAGAREPAAVLAT